MKNEKRETRVPTPDGTHNTPVYRAEKSDL